MNGSPIKVLFIAADTEGCGYARCRLPAIGLNSLEGFEAKATVQLAWDDLLHHDVIVWARQHRKDLRRYRDFAKGMGKVLVYEIDDCLHQIPAWNPASRFYPKGGPELRGIEDWIAACDGLTVSTATLAAFYGAFNSRVAVLPNSLDLRRWIPQRHDGPDIRIGWVGSITHRRDLDEIRPVLKTIRRKYPRVRIIMMGSDGGLRRSGLDVEFHPYVPIDEYPGALAALRLDIAVAPLSRHRFNTYKSHIKYIEYSALGVPCVASRLEPYALIHHGETGFLASTQEEWIDALSALIEDPALCQQVGGEARERVAREFDIRRTARLWGGFFRSLVEEKPRRAALPTGPLLAKMHLLRAVEAVRDGRWSEAIGHLGRGREADPSNAAVRLLLAEGLMAAGDEDQAREEAAAAIGLAARDPEIRRRAERILSGPAPQTASARTP